MTNSTRTRVLAIFSPLPQQLRFQRFTAAVATAVLAVSLRGLLDPVLGHVAFYVTLYMAVAFDAVVSGAASAALSIAVSFLGICYWFVDPSHSLLIVRPSEIHGVAGCFLVCLVLINLGATNRRKQIELRLAHDALEQRVEHRTTAFSQALRKLESRAEMRKQGEERRPLALCPVTNRSTRASRIRSCLDLSKKVWKEISPWVCLSTRVVTRF